MKKILLLSAAALTTASAMALEPKIYDDLQVQGLSADGKIMVCEYTGTITVVNTETGEMKVFEGNDEAAYTFGQGNAISNDGIIVGSTPAGSAYLKDNTWYQLSVPNPQFTNYAQGISPDGSLIAGICGLTKISIEDGDVPMQVPIIWTRQADGTYAEGKILPYPALDFSGRVPQYVTAMCVSDDAKTIIGQVMDYSGSMPSIIVYTLNDQDEWEYNVSFNRMCNPDNLTFPEFPGDSPDAPQLQDFMSDAEKAAYDAAVQAWNEEGTWDYSTYPNIEDYITAEEKAAYDEAYAAYEVEFQAWSDAYNAFDEVLMACQHSGYGLVFNNVMLSGDGKSVVSTVSQLIEDPNSWSGYSELYTPVTINITNADFNVLPNNNVLVSSVAKDNTILGFLPESDNPRQAMVYLPGATEPISLIEYYEAYAPETAEWVKENMVHDAEMYNWETGEFETVFDIPFTGTPFMSADSKVIATAVQNLWDISTDAYIFTYLIPGATTGVKGVGADTESARIAALKGGRILVEGTASSLSVYDTNGRIVFHASNVAGVINTGLQAGTYIVKATTAEGTKVIKTIF